MTAAGMSFASVNADSTCVFCAKIRNGGDEHGRVYPTSDSGIVAFAPLNPVAPGHRLFVPRHHDWHSYNIGKAMHEADRWGQGRAAGSPAIAYNLIVSCGRNATQTVMHPHVHYVPRYAEDGLALPWTDVRCTASLTVPVFDAGVHTGTSRCILPAGHGSYPHTYGGAS